MSPDAGPGPPEARQPPPAEPAPPEEPRRDQPDLTEEEHACMDAALDMAHGRLRPGDDRPAR